MEPNTEVRLGLVMYGGVSLAVYINGVAQEFFQAVRGQGIYELVSKLTESRITVDIISGTSAGGINGIFLAYALANNKNFGDMAGLWRELGDISKLLQDPKKGDTKSLLDSKVFYHESLLQAFKEMQSLPLGEDLHTQEIDLFVTGTNIDGNIYTTFDEMGHPVDVKEHRTVFMLKHRNGRKEPFDPQNTKYYSEPDVAYQALSKLARITSCFPAAFEPVVVENIDPSPDAAYNHPDQCLRYWGNIRKKAYFMDGGILDNKPFSYTIDAIFSRNASTDVERFLCYVEPDPESFEATDSKEPTFIEATLKGGVTITSYESIADDLAAIHDHNSRIQRYNQNCKDLKGKVGGLSGVVPPMEEPEPSLTVYVRSRLNAIADRAVDGLLKDRGHTQHIRDPRKRDQAAQLVKDFEDFRGDGRDTLEYYDVYFRLRRLYHVVYRIKEDICDVGEFDPKIRETKRNLWKALNRQIEVFETIRHWMEYAIDNLPIRWTEGTPEKTRPPRDIWEDVTTAMRYMLNLDDIPSRLGEAYSARELNAPHTFFDQDAITRLHRNLTGRYRRLLAHITEGGGLPQRIEAAFQSLVVWMDDFAARTFQSYGDVVRDFRNEYQQFLSLDAIVYPLEAMGEIRAKDIIRTVRFSPADAKRGFSNRSLNSKLSGDAFAHFAGFFKRSWRSNDILWGRLDGICQLIELLFSDTRITKIVNRSRDRARIRTAVGIDANGSAGLRKLLESTFPGAGDGSIERIRVWLEQLYSDDAAERAHAFNEFGDNLQLLIAMAQLDIIKTDVPKVIEDAIVEQSQWNAFRLARKADLDTAARIVRKSRREAAAGRKTATAHEIAIELALAVGPNTPLVHQYYSQCEQAVNQQPDEQLQICRDAIQTTLPVYDADRVGFVSASSRIDPLIMTVAAEHYAAFGLEGLSDEGRASPEPAYTRLGRFFTTSYRVGSETIIDQVPKVVLLEMICKAILVLKTCLLGSFKPDLRKRVEGNVVFRGIFDVPPRILLKISVSLREDSSVTVAIKSAVTVLALAALVVGVTFWDRLIYPETGFTLRWFLGLIVLPPIVLYVLWLIRIQRVVGWTMAAAGGVAAAGLFIQEFVRVDPAFANDPLRFTIGGIAMQFAGDATRAMEVIRRVTAETLRQGLLNDSSMIMPGYLLIFTGFGAWLSMRRAAGRMRWLGAVICGLVIGAANADRIENRRIAALLTTFNAGLTNDAVMGVLDVSRVKWSALAVLLFFVALAGIGLSWNAHKLNNPQATKAGAATAFWGLLASGIGLWSVYSVSYTIEWSLLAMAVTVMLMGLTIATVCGSDSK